MFVLRKVWLEGGGSIGINRVATSDHDGVCVTETMLEIWIEASWVRNIATVKHGNNRIDLNKLGSHSSVSMH